MNFFVQKNRFPILTSKRSFAIIILEQLLYFDKFTVKNIRVCITIQLCNKRFDY